MTSRYLIRFDDITPGMAWSKFAPFEQVSDELGVPFLIGVVPDCRDPSLMIEPIRADFWDWLRAKSAQGWTVAQHGFTHVYATKARGVLGIGAKSELAGLPYQAQFDALSAGKAILVREGVWHGVFMAPSHSFDETTLKALKALGFTAITDGFGLYPYDMQGLTAVPQLLARPLGFGFGVETVCLHTNTLSEAKIAAHLAFIRANKAAILSFDQAVALPRPGAFWSAMGRVVTKMGLKLYRMSRG